MQVSADSLRTMLHLIAKDLNIYDPWKSSNPVTLTRAIREKIQQIKPKLEDFSISEWEH